MRDFILSNPDIHNDTSKFIIGGGWDHTVWPTTGWPTAVRSQVLHLKCELMRYRPISTLIPSFAVGLSFFKAKIAMRCGCHPKLSKRVYLSQIRLREVSSSVTMQEVRLVRFCFLHREIHLVQGKKKVCCLITLRIF